MRLLFAVPLLAVSILLPRHAIAQLACDALEPCTASAAAAVEAGDYPQAVALYLAATGFDAPNPTLWLHLGQAQHCAADDVAALRSFERAVRLDPAPAASQLALGLASARILLSAAKHRKIAGMASAFAILPRGRPYVQHP